MMQRHVAHAAAVTALFLAALLLAPRADAARLVPAKTAARATPRSRTPFKTAAALESGAPAAGPDAAAPLEAGNATVVAAPEPLAALRVLALGDSITQGSVPSENLNHPYTLQLRKRLQAKLGRPADVTNAAVGGAGIFAVGFHNPVTLVPYAKEMLAKNAKFDWVICLIGINDLLRMGRPADEVMRGLNDIYTPALASGSNVLAIAPLAAPGFVSKDDYKEGERRKLNDEMRAAADAWSASNPKGPLFEVMDLGVDGPMDFWKMSSQERSIWLDDGLHLTEKGYDQMGDMIADKLLSKLEKGGL